MDRRTFLLGAAAAAIAEAQAADSILDIHQHTHYSKRPDDVLVKHQRKMGIKKTILLPAGSRYGLAAEAYGNDSCLALVKQYPGEFYYFANELPDIPEARPVIEKYLKMGAIGIGEQKYPVDSDSKHMQLIASLAQEYNVPVLMHFQHETYNFHIERFHTMLKKNPKVNFIGHAQTFWSNISKGGEQKDLYPKTKVIAGGITDGLLADYPNMFADLSAGSGFNAFKRDPEHAVGFITRHQNKLLFGSDCSDWEGAGEKCIGTNQIEQIRKLMPDKAVQHKIFWANSMKLFRLKA